MQFWIVVHTHRHGIHTYPLFQDRLPTKEQIIAATEGAYEKNREDEYLELYGPFNIQSGARDLLEPAIYHAWKQLDRAIRKAKGGTDAHTPKPRP
jgi:hypothetical protein